MRVALLAVVALALAGGAGASSPGANVSLVFAQELGTLQRGETVPNRSLCAAPPNGLNPTRLTVRRGYALDPDVSPLGSEIAYVEATAFPLGQLYRVSTRGGQAARLAETMAVGWPSWHRDGDLIYFSAPAPGQSSDLDLWTVSRSGGTPARMEIAYPTDGGDPIAPAREVMASAGPSTIGGPDAFAFVRQPLTGSMSAGGELWVSNREGVRRVLDRADITDPDMSTDGQRILFAAPEGVRMAVLLSGGWYQTGVLADRGSDPEFSPDQTRIAFVRDGDVWTMGVNGGEEVNVTHSPIAETGPTWQPAGAPAGTAEPCAIVGTEGDDVLTGSSFDDVVYDQGGNDTIRTLEGADIVYDGKGSDRIETGDGDDEVLLREGANHVDAGAGADEVTTGDFATTLLEPQTIDGGPGDDTLVGGGAADRMLGGDGNDSIAGQRGPDIIFGGPGNDRIQGNRGDDYADGGLGNDILFGGLISGSPPFYDGHDVLLGRGGNDRLAGGWQKDRLFGGTGPDRLRGGPHADHLVGEAGRDDVGGEGGDDLILARDRTRDLLSGGPGFDRARLDAIDRRAGIERLLR
jgi:RTX calcium-binding nonapeptide repeat (4 copies)